MRLIAVALLSAALLAGVLHLFRVDPQTVIPVFSGSVRIAFAGELSGQGHSAGKEMLQALNILAAEVNGAGGVDGLKLEIVPFDDHGGQAGARQVAARIADDDGILAVIGHTTSAGSLAAAPLYASAGIPAITPSATHVDLTRTNPWYFRTIYADDRQAEFLGQYAREALGAAGVVILRTGHVTSERLAGFFRNSARELGVEIRGEMVVNPASPTFAKAIPEVVEAVRPLPRDTVIVLIAPEEPGVAILRAVRDAGLATRILAPDALSSPQLAETFAQLPREQNHPGFYTGRLYVVTPFLPDIAAREALPLLTDRPSHHGAWQTWGAPYAFDAGKLIVAAIQRAGLARQWSTWSSARRMVRDQLAAMSSLPHGVPGATGPLFFESDHTPHRALAVGQFRGRLVPALSQLTYTDTDDHDEELSHAVKLASVVHVGIALDRVADIDAVHRTAKLDFDLWFRHRGGEPAADIVFTNAAEPVSLGPPVEQSHADGEEYELYHVSGRFIMDDTPGHQGLNESHRVGVRFQHRTLLRDRLVFSPEGDAVAGHELAGALSARKVAGTTWAVVDTVLAGDIAEGMSRGSTVLGARKHVREISSLRFEAELAPHDRGLRRRMGGTVALAGALGLAVLLMVLVSVENASRFHRWHRPVLLVVAGVTGLALLAGESAMLEAFDGLGADQAMAATITVFDVAWWLVPAVLVNKALRRFAWDPLEETSEHAIPQVVKSTVGVVIMLIAILGIVSHVFRQDLTSLLATSGVLAMIIGLSLQGNLANVFSGIAINLERPFRRGDWIKVGDAPIGKVIDISWRTTKIETFNNTVISIPNGVAAGARIENASHPNDTFIAQMLLHVALGQDPARVVNLLCDGLRLAKSVDGRKHVGVVWSKFAGVDEYGMRFLISFDLTDRSMLQSQEHAMLVSIHAVLKRAGIGLVKRYASVYHTESDADAPDTAPVSAAPLIDAVDLFQPLPAEVRARLAAEARLRRLGPGDLVIARGDLTRSLFLVAEGVVAVMGPGGGAGVGAGAGGSGDDRVEVARLGPGCFFGEMALLTGEPRTATVRALGPALLYEVDEASLGPCLAADPVLTEALSRIAACRDLEARGLATGERASEDIQRPLTTRMLSRIRTAFGLGTITAEP
jgi:branched-chain amino acid transport system substrate-binding protein